MPDRRPPARTYRPRPQRCAGPAAVAGENEIDTGRVDIVAESNTEQQWLVVVNGVPSSYVDLTDPTRLEFEYTRWIGDLLDLLGEPQQPLNVTHVGGAGCSLARYVASTRPGSRQLVLEYDARLATLMRQAFGLRSERGLRIRAADGRDGIINLADHSTDVIIRDAFVGNLAPTHLRTVEFLTDVARVLTPSGVYVANVADATDQRESRREAATALEVFDEVCLIAEPAHFRGRRHGYRNVLLLASDHGVPVSDLTRRLAAGAVRARLVESARVRELVAGYHPHRDEPSDVPTDTPEHPADAGADAGADAEAAADGNADERPAAPGSVSFLR